MKNCFLDYQYQYSLINEHIQTILGDFYVKEKNIYLLENLIFLLVRGSMMTVHCRQIS